MAWNRHRCPTGLWHSRPETAIGRKAAYIGAPMVIGINGGLLVAVAAYFLIRNHGIREA